MKRPLPLLRGLARVGRGQPLAPRTLWLLLATLLATYFILLSLLTQPPDEAINLVLVLGGALLVIEPLPRQWQPQPGRWSRWWGVALLVAVLWRGQRIMGFDSFSSWLPLLAGFSLALLAAPLNQLRHDVRPLAVLALLPVLRLLGWLTPLQPMSLTTAWLAELLLSLSGSAVLRHGVSIVLEGGTVAVEGPCAGLTMLLQLVVVALVFAIAFPMRHRWQNGLMFLAAPTIAVLINAMRIVLLALINASSWPNKTWWFDFFHWQWGSLIFALLAMQVFVVLYGFWMEKQVAAIDS